MADQAPPQNPEGRALPRERPKGAAFGYPKDKGMSKLIRGLLNAPQQEGILFTFYVLFIFTWWSSRYILLLGGQMTLGGNIGITVVEYGLGLLTLSTAQLNRLKVIQNEGMP